MHRIFKIPILPCAAISLLCILILELSFGHWFRPIQLGNNLIIRNANIEFDITRLYASNVKPSYIRDQYGLRGKYSSTTEIDILTIGGSTTDQRYVPEGYTFQDQLSKRYQETGKDISVVNAGLDGQSTFGYIRNFEIWFNQIPGFKPKYYLFYIGLNDRYLPGDYGRPDNLRPYDQFDQHWKHGFWNALSSRSALYVLFLQVKGMIVARKANAWHGQVKLSELSFQEIPDKLPQLTDEQKATVKGYERRLNILFPTALRFTPSAKLICVTQTGEGIVRKKPSGQLETAYLNEYLVMKELNSKLKAICGNHGGIVFDLANEIRFESGDFYDPIHTTPQGSQRIADYLYRKLAETKINEK